MRMYDIIKKKRDGGKLSEAEIRFAIDGFTNGSVHDYQMSAFAMAVWYSGMDSEETAALTRAMTDSGDTVDLSMFGDKTVDKHSTGGVGDKTSLVVIPIVAALGGITAKMSGRGLGHTGGTVDKLESFYGYKTSLTRDEFISQVKNIGIAITGQSGNLTPADKKLYALRDVTATVDSIPLIASSIMCKKIAAGSHSIVLDVKMGSGAFLKTQQQAFDLAREMVDIGKNCGRNVLAVITDMDAPLGNTVGNALEVKEAIEVLRGGGPEDLKQVCFALASAMLELSLKVPPEQARSLCEKAIADGSAFEKLCEWCDGQGSDRKYALDPDLLPSAPITKKVYSDREGYISAMNTEEIGVCACILGAGRTVKDATVDFGAGIVIHKKTGDYVKKGEAVATLHTSLDTADAVAVKYLGTLSFSKEKPKERRMIIGEVK